MLGISSLEEMNQIAFAGSPFPNPASAITCLPVYSSRAQSVQIDIQTIEGKYVATIFDGKFQVGENRIFLDAGTLADGVYQIRYLMETGIHYRQLIVTH